jgi:hypothetical protein
LTKKLTPAIMKEQNNAPEGAVFTIIVPLDRKESKHATFHLKDMDEDVYMAAKALIDKDKDFDAVRMVIKALHIGGDSPDLLKGNFVAVHSASKLVVKFMQPVEGELKKN